MPIYDLHMNYHMDGQPLAPGVAEGALPFPRFEGKSGRLVDATGAEIPFHIRCDTETGWVQRYDRTGDRFHVDPETNRIKTIVETRPAPLRYVPREDPPCASGEPAPISCAASA